MIIAPTQSNLQAALRSFLTSILPNGNCVFVGTINGTVLTVAKVTNNGTINVGDTVLGNGVAPGTIVQAQISGTTGGAGTYTVSQPQTVSAPTTMSNGVPVLAGQQNRVPESESPDFVVFTPIMFTRLETNIDTYTDAKFTGSITGSTLTITSVFPGFEGEIGVGSAIFGTGVVAGTTVIALGSGSGGTGTYQVIPAQSIPSQTISAGTEQITQHTQATVQIDFHSSGSNAGNWAQLTSTLFRDDFGVQQFANQSPNYGVVPLYADDPVMRVFLNAESQWEWRFSLDAQLQINQVVANIPMQFADSVQVELVDVDVVYPP
jgi:hypothetical protein